ncbi:hypothetical protein CASFOL_015393 [Castilleja foliolosa]|uniref:Uncharacterized protein n=1 Tax=Castilleja foliolosa TaxID=1961234 RepID=A0ABD3DDJ5_9LAMI
MAEINPSPLLHNHNLRSLHATLNPKSLIVSQFPDPQKPNLLKLTTDNFAMERGPRFKEYSALRERKLRMNRLEEQPTPERETDEKLENRSVLTPQRKQVKLGSNFTTPPKRSKIPSILTQSVPDFSSALRKENRRPAALPPVSERSAMTPAGTSKSGRMIEKVGRVTKSTNSAEKRSGGGLMARKSYANMDELKKLGVSAAKEINGGKRRNFY